MTYFRFFLKTLVILSFVAGGICIGLGAAGITPNINNGPPSGIITGVVLLLVAGDCGFLVFMEAGHPALTQPTAATISSPLHQRKIPVQHVVVPVQPPA